MHMHMHAWWTWRPQVLLLVKPGLQSQTVAHPKLLGLLRQLKGARGLCILGSIVPGRLAQQAKLQNLMEKALRRQRDENKLAGFTQVIIPPHIYICICIHIYIHPTSTPHLPHIYPTSTLTSPPHLPHISRG